MRIVTFLLLLGGCVDTGDDTGDTAETETGIGPDGAADNAGDPGGMPGCAVLPDGGASGAALLALLALRRRRRVSSRAA